MLLSVLSVEFDPEAMEHRFGFREVRPLAGDTGQERFGVLELAGNLSLIDVRSDHRVSIPEGDWTTLGGFVFARIGRVPKVGDRVSFPGGDLEVIAMDGRRVAGVRVNRGRTN